MLRRTHEQKADVGVGAEGREQLGDGARSISSALRRRFSSIRVHEAEVARAKHHGMRVGDIVLLAGSAPAGGLLQRLADGRVVLVPCAHAGHGPARERALDELVQAVAVALLERHALSLAMV